MQQKLALDIEAFSTFELAVMRFPAVGERIFAPNSRGPQSGERIPSACSPFPRPASTAWLPDRSRSFVRRRSRVHAHPELHRTEAGSRTPGDGPRPARGRPDDAIDGEASIARYLSFPRDAERAGKRPTSAADLVQALTIGAIVD